MIRMRKLSQKYGGLQFFAEAFDGIKVVETSLRFGADPLKQGYLGNTPLDRIYLGTDLVYQTIYGYDITETLTHVTPVGTRPTTIEKDSTLALKYAPEVNYELPDTVAVAGATSDWSRLAATLTLSNPVSAVTVKVVGVELTQTIPEAAYTLKNEPTLTPTHADFEFGISGGWAATRIIVDETGIKYDVDTLGITQVYNAATKTWTEEKYKSIAPTGDAKVSETFYAWWTANITAKLATPQNVAAIGSETSWDEVENATEYEVVADGTTTLGTVEKAPQGYTDCLTFTGKTSDFTLKATNKTWDGTLEWSTDHNTWTTLTGTEEMQSVDKKLYLRGKGNTTFYDENQEYFGVLWVLSAKADCAGNIQTLLDCENPPMSISTIYCYGNMFDSCTNLTSAPELPATTLVEGCYQDMFNGCTSLTAMPELPATTLANSCYQGMFYHCTGLASAPELPATTLADRCYQAMFESCTNLTTAPELPATTLAVSCYGAMFRECTNLTTTPALPATTLASDCYSEMFRDCTNLTTVPELPATILANGCYIGMFFGCTNLKVNTTSGNKIFTCPSTIPIGEYGSAVKSMFENTGGTFTGTPTAGTTYYWTE